MIFLLTRPSERHCRPTVDQMAMERYVKNSEYFDGFVFEGFVFEVVASCGPICLGSSGVIGRSSISSTLFRDQNPRIILTQKALEIFF